ncbi:pirin-like C-terminal cupin domain-containing protein [Streptomyces bicolor]|uniref:pirin-like C-terminal cupin domain-containing protein n=1 Tax=Streptomyces bicolor TaxID=66874 RepID=UPI000A52448D|nr:pirin-like C-terminal cupin domain-containing protein [Streptomyces bicolor]
MSARHRAKSSQPRNGTVWCSTVSQWTMSRHRALTTGIWPPISGSVITLAPGRSLDQVLPGRHRALFTMLSGAVNFAGRAVTAGQTAWSDPVPDPDLSVIGLRTADGDTPSVVMTFSGPPIRQPVALGGPMVMNTQAEIRQAFRDLRTGKFGAIPRQARLRYR